MVVRVRCPRRPPRARSCGSGCPPAPRRARHGHHRRVQGRLDRQRRHRRRADVGRGATTVRVPLIVGTDVLDGLLSAPLALAIADGAVLDLPPSSVQVRRVSLEGPAEAAGAFAVRGRAPAGTAVPVRDEGGPGRSAEAPPARAAAGRRPCSCPPRWRARPTGSSRHQVAVDGGAAEMLSEPLDVRLSATASSRCRSRSTTRSPTPAVARSPGTRGRATPPRRWSTFPRVTMKLTARFEDASRVRDFTAYIGSLEAEGTLHRHGVHGDLPGRSSRRTSVTSRSATRSTPAPVARLDAGAHARGAGRLDALPVQRARRTRPSRSPGRTSSPAAGGCRAPAAGRVDRRRRTGARPARRPRTGADGRDRRPGAQPVITTRGEGDDTELVISADVGRPGCGGRRRAGRPCGLGVEEGREGGQGRAGLQGPLRHLREGRRQRPARQAAGVRGPQHPRLPARDRRGADRLHRRRQGHAGDAQVRDQRARLDDPRRRQLRVRGRGPAGGVGDQHRGQDGVQGADRAAGSGVHRPGRRARRGRRDGELRPADQVHPEGPQAHPPGRLPDVDLRPQRLRLRGARHPAARGRDGHGAARRDAPTARGRCGTPRPSARPTRSPPRWRAPTAGTSRRAGGRCATRRRATGRRRARPMQVLPEHYGVDIDLHRLAAPALTGVSVDADGAVEVVFDEWMRSDSVRARSRSGPAPQPVPGTVAAVGEQRSPADVALATHLPVRPDDAVRVGPAADGDRARHGRRPRRGPARIGRGPDGDRTHAAGRAAGVQHPHGRRLAGRPGAEGDDGDGDRHRRARAPRSSCGP